MQLDIGREGEQGVENLENVEYFEISTDGVFVEFEDGTERAYDNHEVYGGNA